MRKTLGVLLLAAALSTVVAQSNAPMHGSWRLVSNIDLITDENKSWVGGLVTTYPGYSNQAGLIIRCDDREPIGVEVFFFADQYIGSQDYFSVVYRVDGGDPVTGTWYASTTGQGVFAPSSIAPSLISDLLDAQQLVFRVTSFSGPETYVQPVVGLRGALSALGCYTGQL